MTVVISGTGVVTLDFKDSSTLTLALDNAILEAAAREETSKYSEDAGDAVFAVIDYPHDFKVIVDGKELSTETYHIRLCGFILQALVDRAMLVRARTLAEDIKDEDLAVFSPAELEELRSL